MSALSSVWSPVLTESEDVTEDNSVFGILSSVLSSVLTESGDVTEDGNKKLNRVLTTANPSSIILLIKYFKQRRLSAEVTLPGKRFFVAKFEGSIKRYGQLQSERTL